MDRSLVGPEGLVKPIATGPIDIRHRFDWRETFKYKAARVRFPVFRTPHRTPNTNHTTTHHKHHNHHHSSTHPNFIMSESGSEMSYADVVASGPQQSAEEVSSLVPPRSSDHMPWYLFVCYSESLTRNVSILGVRPTSHDDGSRDGNNPTDDETYSRANPVDEVIPTDQSVESLIDVNTGVAVVPNDFLEQEVCVSPAHPLLSHPRR